MNIFKGKGQWLTSSQMKPNFYQGHDDSQMNTIGRTRCIFLQAEAAEVVGGAICLFDVSQCPSFSGIAFPDL